MHKRNALCLALLTLALQTAWGWGCRWMAHPAGKGAGQVLFRHTYTFSTQPRRAHIVVDDRGRHVLYVNGYNVSEAAFAGGTCHYDVARFLHEGENIIAIWHAAATGVGLSFYGTTWGGERFSFGADGTWLCRAASGETLDDGRETFDATLYDTEWKTDGTAYPAWTGAVEIPSDSMATNPRAVAYRVRRTISPSHIYNNVENGKVAYHFGETFTGLVRLTLRGMERGATVKVNGLSYTCSGETDEQCCRRFTVTTQEAAVVELPTGASADNITNVEGLEIKW